MRRAIPSLSPAVIAEITTRSKGRPGKLRSIVRRLDGETIVSPADLERILEPKDGVTVNSVRAEPALVRCERLLDQGRYDEAASLLGELTGDQSIAASIARARLALGRGDPKAALAELDTTSAAAESAKTSKVGRNWFLNRARAHLRRGEYTLADEAAKVAEAPGAGPGLEAEALSVRGLAESYTGHHESARALLERAVELSRTAGDLRVEGLTLASLALALQRNEQLSEAKNAYEAALRASEAAGEAGAVATIRLNLAALTQGQGEFAQALSHLEAAVDMGGRAGRRSTTQQALLNLANLDLYLGRFARARTTIESLCAQRATLAPGAEAQLLGLEADLGGAHGRRGGRARALRVVRGGLRRARPRQRCRRGAARERALGDARARGRRRGARLAGRQSSGAFGGCPRPPRHDGAGAGVARGAAPRRSDGARAPSKTRCRRLAPRGKKSGSGAFSKRERAFWPTAGNPCSRGATSKKRSACWKKLPSAFRATCAKSIGTMLDGGACAISRRPAPARLRLPLRCPRRARARSRRRCKKIGWGAFSRSTARSPPNTICRGCSNA